MSAVPSDAISTVNNLRDCAVVSKRLVALDQGQYRRQIQHFEYYWGLRKGEIDLASPLNHILLREDMAKRLDDIGWTILPTPETLEAMYRMAQHNQSSGMHSRRNLMEEISGQEFEYDFVPLHILDHRRLPLYVDYGTSIKSLRKPFKSMPRIKSSAHPLFVLFMTFDQLNLSAAVVMPVKQAKAMLMSVGRIVWCWVKEPPAEFLVGPGIAARHRHPLSDAGCEDAPVPRGAKRNSTSSKPRVRKVTQAPCKQRKAAAAAKPYARLDPRPPRARKSALPIAGVESDDDRLPYPTPDLRAWLVAVTSSGDDSAAPRGPSWSEGEAGHDDMLTRYRAERTRDADNALDPLTNVLMRSGLIFGDGLDWSAYSSNNWAKRIHGVCLLGADPFGKAKK
ncbi:hypothetical protein HDZ31DRAFT_42111 [Schizophyllum fasciatum]